MSKIVVDFTDEEALYARIIVDGGEIREIKQTLDDYREQDEEYNIDDFLKILKTKGIRFDRMPITQDNNIYF